MVTFVEGLVIGAFIGFFLCDVVQVKRIEKPHDRRGPQKATFPLTDCDGVVVLNDRRMQPDRRLGAVKTLQ